MIIRVRLTWAVSIENHCRRRIRALCVSVVIKSKEKEMLFVRKTKKTKINEKQNILQKQTIDCLCLVIFTIAFCQGKTSKRSVRRRATKTEDSLSSLYSWHIVSHFTCHFSAAMGIYLCCLPMVRIVALANLWSAAENIWQPLCVKRIETCAYGFAKLMSWLVERRERPCLGRRWKWEPSTDIT